MKAVTILMFLVSGVVIGIGLGPALHSDCIVESVCDDHPPVLDGVVLVDINSMLDVGFRLFDPEGREVDYFESVDGESGHYSCEPEPDVRVGLDERIKEC